MVNDTIEYDVVGIGNAIVDVLAKVGDGFLSERGLAKGDMTLLEAGQAGEIYEDIIPEREISGGSAANTVAAIASLGGTPAFIGKVHDDELGQEFGRDIGAAGVDFFTEPLLQGPSTARSIVLVTPDAQRSMFTYLGASRNLTVDDIDERIIAAAKVVFLEAYLFDDEKSAEALRKAAKIAHQYNRQVALTLSDKNCIQRHRPEFLDFIHEYVDILFANDDEITALFEIDDFYKALDLIKPEVEIAALTRGAKGSVVVNNRIKVFVEAETIEDVVDSTGAGDVYAGGFLFGLTHGRTLGTCALIGNIAASEILSHYGARAEVSLRGFVRNKLRSYGKTL